MDEEIHCLVGADGTLFARARALLESVELSSEDKEKMIVEMLCLLLSPQKEP